MIEMQNDIAEELKKTESLDEQVEHTVADKVLESTFKPVVASENAICIHQSRSITC